MDKVYAIEYCDCIWESHYHPISLHKTKKGAVKAMQELKRKMITRYAVHGSDFFSDKGFRYQIYPIKD